ncbi:MAG: transglycosylase SLT domain-containing protein [Bacteroidota bacterium]
MTENLDIARLASRHGVPPDLLKAIVEVESGGDPRAMRYEPEFDYLVDPDTGESFDGEPDAIPAPSGVSPWTEYIGQRTSWGPMQIMGATARELGFEGRFFTELCDEGLEWGCRYLVRLRERHGDWEAAAAAYNAGSPRRTDDGEWENQEYIDKLKEAGWAPTT